jgi:hypothetical protein
LTVTVTLSRRSRRSPSACQERGALTPAGTPPPPPIGAPRWAQRAAVLAVMTTVPSGIWRLSMALGLPVGVNESYRREHYGFAGWGTVYVVALTLLLLGLATLTLGLVRRWGEVTPRWMPFVGGKRVPPLAAIVPAATGALALTVMWVGVFLNAEDIFVVYGLEGSSRIVLIACYAPLLLWGPLLAAVTISYARRSLAQSVHAGQRNDD